ncbi:MAG: dGTP triphosphohydrolase [Patescibacteria group bacterium]
MLLTRQDLEKREREVLAPYATFSDSIEREHPDPSTSSGQVIKDKFRTAFQRDHARIIHSKAFRRLKGKTQVFVAHHGDHFRNRLSHSLEVAQIAKNLARNLGVNEDLTTAIALAHDLGHTPFGHTGEEKLNELLQPFGERFEHNRQSRRILTTLEKKYAKFDGLNLTLDLLDGLAKHSTPYDAPEEEDGRQPSLEAQIVNLADEIAYTNHDLDDGLRAGIFRKQDLKGLQLWEAATEKVDPKLPAEAFNHRAVSALIDLLTCDLLTTTEGNLNKNKINSLKEVQNLPKPLVEFSENISAKLDELRKFLREEFYLAPSVAQLSQKGTATITKIFEALLKEPELLPTDFQKIQPTHTAIADFVAGMTDNYANEFCAKITRN